jgi:nicotinamidase/pyrazinamidase
MVGYDSRTALIVVDVQNDFADPEGSLSVQGGAEVVAVANSEAESALRAGAFIAYSQDWHPEETPHFADFGGIWPVHCVAGTWGAEFAPGLEVQGEVIRKGTNGEDGYSAFTMRDPVSGETVPTALGAMLAERSIERAVVLGLATDYCVKATALDALAAGLAVTVLTKGVRAVDLEPGDGQRALEEIRAAGGEIL